MAKYLCKDSISNVYVEYVEKDHILAAKRCAMDAFEKIKNGNEKISELEVHVVDEFDNTYSIQIEFISIRSQS
jgi:hypothetical protein